LETGATEQRARAIDHCSDLLDFENEMLAVMSDNHGNRIKEWGGKVKRSLQAPDL
jgi:hypothetical protein